MESSGLCQVGTHEINRHDRIAAMWAAAYQDEFDEASAAGGARTVRGIHAKWKEGRALFPGDREFGQWLAENVLSQVAIAPDNQAAAVWVAETATWRIPHVLRG